MVPHQEPHADPGDIEAADSLSPEAARRLIHELRVHQTELESQNEELRRAQHELEVAHGRYFDLYELTPVGYCTVSANGLITETNLTAVKLLGLEKRLLIGRPLTRLVVADDQDIYYQHSQRLWATNEPQGCELRLRRADGSQFWARLDSTVATDSDGVTLARVIVSDINDRRLAEGLLQTRHRQIALLSDIAAQLLHATDPQTLIQQICGEVMAELDCQVFFNYLLDADAQRFHLHAWAGVSDAFARSVEWASYGTAICGCVRSNERHRPAEDPCEDGGSPPGFAESLGIRAYASFPFASRGRIVGTLGFGVSNRSHFTREDIELMKTVANQIAIAIERVRSENEINKLNATLERRVQQRTAQIGKLTLNLSNAEQRERKRFAAMLHDNLQQLLVAATMDMKSARRHAIGENPFATLDRVNGLLSQLISASGASTATDRDNMHQQLLLDAQTELQAAMTQAANGKLLASLGHALDLLADSIKASKSLTGELAPPVLHETGLVAAMNWLSRWMLHTHGLTVEVTSPCEIEPDPHGVCLLFFRFVRELLLNVVKHSGTNAAQISISQPTPGQVQVVVSDQGAGFALVPAGHGDTGSGFGLYSIRERLELLEGRLEIDSSPGRGTRITLTAPIETSTRPQGGGPSPRRTCRKPVRARGGR